MSNTPNIVVTHTRWCGAAAMLGGMLLVLATAIFAVTHGTQSAAQSDTLFGLKSAQYAKIFKPTIWLLFLLGLNNHDIVCGFWVDF